MRLLCTGGIESLSLIKYFANVSTALLFGFFLVAVGFSLSLSCSSDSEERVSFDHGVASGDPLENRVILWTRVTPQESQETVSVKVEVASDKEFGTIVYSSAKQATAESDYTVKIDAEGLSPGTVYYYRFRSGEAESVIGRTKTLPRGDVDLVRLAVVSCANYPLSHGGYFNVYGHAAEADVDAVVHLGDYIYEYGRAPGSGDDNPEAAERDFPEGSGEIITLDDYRGRYALYRTDPQLQAIHAAHPFIAVWDDHEVADNAYAGGALNHNEGEGSFDARKQAALQAYYEWMPIRPAEDNDSQRIYGSFSFGNLVDLFMLDTRLAGREKQLAYEDYFDQTGFNILCFTQDVGSVDRTLLGSEQLLWLQENLVGSTSVWQVLGQQVLMGRMNVPAELLSHFANPTPQVVDIVDELAGIKERVLQGDPSVTQTERGRVSFGLPYNLDAWDGYPAEREAVLGTAYSEDKNLVVLSGDSHNGWANNLKDINGNQVGVEFAGPAVSSEGLAVILGLGSDPERSGELARSLEVLVDDLVYSNIYDYGYMIVSFTPEKAQSQWIYVDTIKQPEFMELKSSAKTLSVLAGEGNRSVVSD